MTYVCLVYPAHLHVCQKLVHSTSASESYADPYYVRIYLWQDHLCQDHVLSTFSLAVCC